MILEAFKWSDHFHATFTFAFIFPKETESGSVVTGFWLSSCCAGKHWIYAFSSEISPTQTATCYQVLKHSYCPGRFQAYLTDLSSLWFYSILTLETLLMLDLLLKKHSASTVWAYSISTSTVITGSCLQSAKLTEFKECHRFNYQL